MTVAEIRQAYLDYFKDRGHVVVPSAKIVPENDPTTLFTGSGMQPMLPYFLGEPHPQGVRVADVQKCFRAGDIEEVGDNRHTTFFEMLGNWSFGDYFKKEQVPWAFTFLTEVLKLDPRRLYFTCYKGNDALGIPRDTEAATLWQKLYEALDIPAGIAENPEGDGIREGERIFYYDDTKNWWSRVGEPKNMPEGEPGGPDTEMFFDFGDHGQHMNSQWRDLPCHVNCDCGRFVEIGNNVFMEYVKTKNGFEKLPKPNVDFGAGLERITMAVKDVDDIFMIDTMQLLIRELAAVSGKDYGDHEYQKSFRVVADHIRGATFMIADGVFPGNTDQSYVLRRLIRRSIRHLDTLSVDAGTLTLLADRVVTAYRDQYPELDANRLKIQEILREEEIKFRKTLSQGIREFDKWTKEGALSGKDAFILFSTYGFPFELTQELADERGIVIDQDEFEREMEQHRKQSRAGAGQKFKGGLADSSEATTKLHTATHLLLAGLRKELGNHVHQAGSNITAERTRFDFTHDEKVTRETLDAVEAYVNEAIQKGIEVVVEQMDKNEAQKMGVEGSFWDRYPDVVNVYNIITPDGVVYSRELCGGPHVQNTQNMGTFKIIKEEASAAGVRRIKAVLE
ncbi:MAG: alanine--tRNA ligase [Patescibacteria group bacterium UBA2163]